MAPRTRSSHMKRKRSCPGVPNKYRIKSSPSVMRPKSIATVVDVLVGEAEPASSTPSLTRVIAASVVSGVISEIEPTNVVFPTANPPAMMILTGIGTLSDSLAEESTSERLKAIENPFQKLDIGTVAGLRRRRGMAVEQPFIGHIADEYACHTQCEFQVCRHFGDRLGDS